MDETQEKTKRRISNAMGAAMIFVAVIMDLLGPVGAVLGTIIFALWFVMLQVPLIGPKQLVRWGLNFLGEAATAGVWAGMTVGVTMMILLTRTEDRLGVNILDKVGTRGVGKATSTTAVRTERKAARRALDPERTARAQERLARLQERKSAPQTTPVRERQTLKDIRLPGAA